MNALETAYKILKNLESAKDVDYMGTLISIATNVITIGSNIK